MGDRVAVMSMGVLQQVDRPQALYDAPKRLRRDFIGTPPMNLFRGTVLGDNGTVSVTLAGRRSPWSSRASRATAVSAR